MWSSSIASHFINVCSDTDDPSRNIRFIIIDQLNNTNSLSQMALAICCYKKKDFGFQHLSLYITDLIGHITEIENIIQNMLNKDRPYDN